MIEGPRLSRRADAEAVALAQLGLERDPAAGQKSRQVGPDRGPSPGL